MKPWNCHPSRRGSIYVTVLGASTLVLVIGLGAVLAGRVQAKTAATANDFAEARLYARSGLELAMLTIYNDPYWRLHLGNGGWYTNKAMGSGSFSLSARDPVDNDVVNGDNNPVILTSTGVKGTAKYMLSMRMEVSARTGSCLEVSLCAGGNISANGATLTSDQTISSNANTSTNGSSAVNANVEAYHQVQGSGYTQTTRVTGLQRTMPDPLHALDYYVANGTAIPYTALAAFNSSELIANEKFETDVSGWYAISGCLVKQSTSTYKEGLAALRCTSRNSVADAAATDLPLSSIAKGHVYDVNFPVYSAGAANMAVVLTITTDTGTYTCSTTPLYVLQNTWTNLATPNNAPLAPTWSGTPTKATVSVTSDATNKDYFLDGLSFKDVTYSSNTYVVEGQLFSPTNNPYGSPNAKGIYVINGGGKNIVIADSRVVGTLVLRGVNSGSGLERSMCMEPILANYPVFMTDSQVTIGLSSASLSEVTAGRNLNPSGVPYPYSAGMGTYTNSTATDTYTSAISGLVYSTADLTIDTNTTINGVVIAGGKAQINASTLTLHYNNIYLNNPPPGFTVGTIQMTPVPGTWQRVAN